MLSFLPHSQLGHSRNPLEYDTKRIGNEISPCCGPKIKNEKQYITSKNVKYSEGVGAKMGAILQTKEGEEGWCRQRRTASSLVLSEAPLGHSRQHQPFLHPMLRRLISSDVFLFAFPSLSGKTARSLSSFRPAQSTFASSIRTSDSALFVFCSPAAASNQNLWV